MDGDEPVPPEGREVWEEIRRLRERVHQLFSYTAALRMRADDMDRWRTEHSKLAEAYMRRVDELVKTDEIAEAITKKMQARNRLELSLFQRFGALVIFAATLAGSIKVLFFS